MSEKKWVQHISGQGEKWEVVVDNAGNAYQWWVRSGPAPCGWHYLPKSEYALCPPPEVWRDVSDECDVEGGECLCVINHAGVGVCTSRGYRLRKMQLWQTNGLDGKNCAIAAFIVEQKVSQ